IMATAARHGLAVVEDACQAHLGTSGGRPVGSIGAAGALSFYPTKNLGALGDGGAVVTNDAALAERLRRLRHLGQSARYVHEEPAGHSRLDELQAALLRVKLAHLDAWTTERRTLAARYAALLGPLSTQHSALSTPLRLPREPEGTACCWHQYVVEVAEGTRAAFRSSLRDAGVGTDVHYPTPVHLQPGYAAYGTGSGSLPITERLAQTVVSLPMFVGLTEEEQDRVATAVQTALQDQPAID
ncbi:MAG: DegT/DnrJ/EryC1/StrS family aminotransferase, partial [Dehalococcoidia bacterium]